MTEFGSRALLEAHLKVYHDVKNFHEVFSEPILNAPAFPSEERRRLRRDLVEEEYEELMAADWDDDLVEVADGITDLVYVLMGMALEYGIPMNPIWDEVHKTNMAKAEGGVHRNSAGKIIKPDDWTPPNIAKILTEHGYTKGHVCKCGEWHEEKT